MKKLRTHELQRIDLQTYQSSKKLPLVIVLDNVRSMNNIGSIFRTSDAYLVAEIMLCGISACPPHHDIHKTALGAEDAVKWSYYEDTCEAIKVLKSRNYQVYAVEQATDSIMLDTWEMDVSRKYAFVLGNEVRGVQQAVIDLCDYCLELPQHGTKHSLNVSIAGGIIIWEAYTKYQK